MTVISEGHQWVEYDVASPSTSQPTAQQSLLASHMKEDVCEATDASAIKALLEMQSGKLLKMPAVPQQQQPEQEHTR